MIREFKGDYHFLSNFSASPIVFEGQLYPTVEHAYQAAKTLHPGQRDYVRGAATASSAKRLGKTVQMRPGWESMKGLIMLALVSAKFQSPGLRQKLLDTGEQELEEGNDWNDRCWGVDLRTGQGDNRLGKILMAIRDEAGRQSG